MTKHRTGGANPSQDGELLAQMLSEAKQTSGAEALPNISGPAEAWTPGHPVATPAMTLADTTAAYRAGMDFELAANAAALGDMGLASIAVENGKKMVAAQAQVSSPPQQVAYGNEIRTLPQSLLRVPRILHQFDAVYAMKLFSIFCAGKKKMVSVLAAKSGCASQPFVYLTQALYKLLEMESFHPEVRMNKDGTCIDPSFSPIEMHPQGEVQDKLRSWAGPELAKLITDRCQRANISLLAGLKQMYKKLDQNRLDELGRAQKHQTVYQWGGVEEDDDD